MKARENEVLEAQLQLSFLSGKMGKEALGQSMTQVLAVSHMLAYGKVFEVSRWMSMVCSISDLLLVM
jgi:hypothetical protein